VRIGGRSVQVNETVLVSGSGNGARRLIWSFYAMDGLMTSTVLQAKRHQVEAYFARNGCPSAFIAVAVDLNSAAGPETLERFLAGMESPSGYLCKPTGS